MINLTATFDFQPLFKGHLRSGKEWHWKGKDEVYVHGFAFDDKGAISIFPQAGELIWNSSGFCRVLERRAMEREEKKARASNGQEAPTISLSAKANEVE